MLYLIVAVFDYLYYYYGLQMQPRVLDVANVYCPSMYVLIAYTVCHCEVPLSVGEALYKLNVLLLLVSHKTKLLCLHCCYFTIWIVLINPELSNRIWF